MWGMTWWEMAVAALLLLFMINVLFVLACLCMARNERRRNVTRVDDVSGLHVFDDDDF